MALDARPAPAEPLKILFMTSDAFPPFRPAAKAIFSEGIAELGNRVDWLLPAQHADFRLIWMVREPRSVVYSMLHNWKRGALNRLYEACGSAHYQTPPAARSMMTDWIGPSRLDKACASYMAKTEQTHELRKRLGDRIMIVDYDDLVLHREVLLPRLFEFAGVELNSHLFKRLHGNSVRKGNNLAEWEATRVAALCAPAYRRARAACTIGSAHGA
jgi:hypothetical protein